MDGVSEHEDRFLRYETPSETSADAVAARPEHIVRVSTEGNTRPARDVARGRERPMNMGEREG